METSQQTAKLLRANEQLQKEIEERKRAVEKLRLSEARFRNLFDTSRDAILLLKQKTGQILEANPAACRLYGYSQEEFLALKATDISAEPEKTRAAVRQYVPHVPLRIHRKKDGTVFPVEITSGFFDEGGLRLHTAFIRDITERMRKEEQLLVANFAIQSAISAVGFADLEGRVTFVNDSFLRLWGYDRPDEVVGRHISEFAVAGMDEEGVKAARSGRGYIGEGLAKKKDGSPFHVQVAVSTVHADEGQPVCAMASFIDITERNKAEEALSESEERYRVAIESSNDGVALIRGDEHVFVNNRLLDMFGYESEEIIGKPLFITVHPDDREMVARRIQEGERGEAATASYEFRGVTKQGAVKYIEASAARVTYRGEPAGLAYLRDITERKLAEEELQTSRLQLATAAGLARIAYWEYDETAAEFVFNDPFYDLYGTTAEQEGGYRMSRAKYRERFVHPEDREELRRQAYDNRARPRPDRLEQYEHRGVRSDGKAINILTRNRVVTDQEGRVLKLVGVNQDITERKRMENALRESEAKFRSYVECSPLAVLVVDQEGRIVDVNWAATILLGYDAATLLHMHLWDIHQEKDRQDVMTGFATFLREGHIEVESRFQRKDGSLIWVSMQAAVVGGGISLAYCSDITAKRQAAEVLKRYELMSGRSRDIIFFTGTDGNILEANVAAEKAHGYSREELLGLTIKDLRADGTLGVTGDQIVKARDGLLFEAIHRRKDGSTFPVEVSVSTRPATVRGESTLLSIVRDITERKKHQEQIEMLKRSVDVHYDAAFWMDTDNKFVYVNDAACKALGYSCEELIGMTVFDINQRATPDRMNEVWAALREGRSFIAESVHRRKDGSEFPVEVTSTYVEFGGRELICAFARDITEKKKLEEQLHQSQKMEAIGTLAGGVAHDFNNMLAVIIGNAELALDEDRLEIIRGNLKEILSASMRSRDLVKQILTFSRRDGGREKAVHIVPLVKETYDLLRASLPTTIDMKLTLRTKSDAVVTGDASQIQQVVMNLASNAAFAMRDHGGTLTIGLSSISLGEGSLATSNMKAGRYVKLTVRDTGTGISPEVQNRMFDPFFTTKAPGEGTGMGLSVVYGIVQNLGGLIEAKSEPGKGSKFTVLIPESYPLLVEGEKEESPTAAYGERVLFIDDEPGVVEMTRTTMERLGYHVTTTRSASHALELFTKNPQSFDLVITDQTMPGMTGVELSRKILSIRGDVPIILCTGYSETVSADTAKQAGIRELVMKPVTKKELGQAVSRVLGKTK